MKFDGRQVPGYIIMLGGQYDDWAGRVLPSVCGCGCPSKRAPGGDPSALFAITRTSARTANPLTPFWTAPE